MQRSSSRIHSTEDARRLARRRLPRIAYDFVEGAAGREVGSDRNERRFDELMLQPRVMQDVTERNLGKSFLGRQYDLPFGIAPMGLCNLVWPGSDQVMGEIAKSLNLPVCISSSASSRLEDMRRWAGDNAWFQLYFGRSEDASIRMVTRAGDAGYRVLVLTVDVPQLSRRVRDQRNGLNIPFRMSLRTCCDFCLHPRWLAATLMSGIPSPRNFASGPEDSGFDRFASRAGADWRFAERLRKLWPGEMVVKGVATAEEAVRIRNLGADAVYVSNHGARQLDSAPPAIDLLAPIRDAVGPDYPLLFDSGIRSGEDIIKALACGADFVMMGRPVLYALGADGAKGLNALLNCFAVDVDIAMAQLGIRRIGEIGPHVIWNPDHPAEGANR
ncbi:MAG: alpha-hydroxy acid oxidase [Rhodobacteraceae bacterium]|nr:alpha-hydroxy acid oxidase [Paracoccaceae bacterium]